MVKKIFICIVCLHSMEMILFLVGNRNNVTRAKILKISFRRVEIETTTYRVYSQKLVPLHHDWSQMHYA